MCKFYAINFHCSIITRLIVKSVLVGKSQPGNSKSLTEYDLKKAFWNPQGSCLRHFRRKMENNRSENKNWMQNPVSSAQYQVPSSLPPPERKKKEKRAEKVLTVSGRLLVSLTAQHSFPLTWRNKADEERDRNPLTASGTIHQHDQLGYPSHNVYSTQSLSQNIRATA